jgi:predicted DsbA family dithiol-disulfide isomerase
MRPVVDGLVKEYAGRYDIKVMDTSSGDATVETLAQSFGIQYVPTFVFLNRDGTRSGTIVGEATARQLESALAKLK